MLCFLTRSWLILSSLDYLQARSSFLTRSGNFMKFHIVILGSERACGSARPRAPCVRPSILEIKGEASSACSLAGKPGENTNLFQTNSDRCWFFELSSSLFRSRACERHTTIDLQALFSYPRATDFSFTFCLAKLEGLFFLEKTLIFIDQTNSTGNPKI